MEIFFLFFGAIFYISITLNIWLYIRAKERNNKKVFAKLALFVFSIVIVFCVFEYGILQLKFMVRKFGSLEYENIDRQLKLNALKNAKKNPYKFRVHPGSKQKKNKVKRIVVMGDSFVWGDGLEIKDIWSRKLAKRIKDTGYKTEVIDFGICGWSTSDQFKFLLNEGIKYNPDLIIWGFVSNDPDLRYDHRVTLENRIDTVFRLGLPFSYLFPRLRDFLRKRIEENLQKTKWFKHYGYAAWENRLYKKYRLKNYSDLIHKIALFLNKQEIPFFFVTLPNSPSANFVKKYSLIESIMKKNDVPFLDLYPKIKEKFGHIPKEDWKFELAANPANGHPGKKITRVYAEEVFKYLNEYYPEYLH